MHQTEINYRDHFFGVTRKNFEAMQTGKTLIASSTMASEVKINVIMMITLYTDVNQHWHGLMNPAQSSKH